MALGLLAPLVPPSTAQATDEPYLEQDRRGDASPFGEQLGLDGIGVSLDIVEVGIGGEDEVSFHVRVRLEDLRAETPPAWSDVLRVEFGATAPGGQFQYRLSWTLLYPSEGAAPTGKAPVEARFCLEKDRWGGPCHQQRVKAWVDWDQSEVHADVTKDALMGRAPVRESSPAGSAPRVRAQSPMTELRATTERYLGSTSYRDEWSGLEPFVFETDAANLNLTLARRVSPAANASAEAADLEERMAASTVSVMPGAPTAVPLVVENLNPVRRLVQIEAQTSDDGGRWTAEVAPAVQVPPGDRRVVTLILNATPEVQHLDSVVVRVLARSVGQSSELGAVVLDAVASVPLSPERRTLHLHAAPAPDGSGLCIGCESVRRWMNTLENDPRGSLDGSGFTSRSDASVQDSRFDTTFELDAPLVRDLVLDASQRVRGQVGLVADPPFAGRVTVTLSAGKLVVGAQQFETDVGTEPVAFTLPVPPRAARIPAGQDGLALTVEVVAETAAAPASSITGVRIVPKESRLELPVVPDPEAGLERGELAVSFLALHALSEPHEFVNPGKARLLNFTLLNEGHEPTESRVVLDTGLATEGAPAEWAYELRPATHFVLKPGESVRVGLLVRPPPEAREGDTAWARIRAFAGDEARPHSQLKFSAIATNAVSYPDESTYFRADAEDEAKVVRPAQAESPGLPWWGLGAGLLLILMWRRRQMV